MLGTPMLLAVAALAIAEPAGATLPGGNGKIAYASGGIWLMGLLFGPKPRTPQAFPELTGREEEILGLTASGHENAEIADRLFLSLKTVQNHVSNIFRKRRAADRVQAALRAREAGLGGVGAGTPRRPAPG